MNRYLGTKTKILSDIREVITDLGVIEGSIADVFSGSVAVSLYFKKLGYQIVANDINPLSFAYAKAYIEPNSISQFNISKLFPKLPKNKCMYLKEQSQRLIDGQKEMFSKNNLFGEFSSWGDYSKQMGTLGFVLSFLSNPSARWATKPLLREDVYENYTKKGKRSSYHSVRGTRGKRNYFSPENARVIDFYLTYLRHWWREGLLSEQNKYTLISVLLDSMERYVNIQGTYHDFPRNELEARAKNQFKVQMPNYFGLLHSRKKHMVGCGDSLEFVKTMPYVDVLYIDPPYNFRQYTAYYHLPNFMARYPDIDDLDKYLSELEFVRGQNMNDDFASPFSNRDSFLFALNELIERANCKYVVLSYYDGANHWNRFLEKDNSKGFKLLSGYFENSSVFKRKSFNWYPVKRTNYQSQNGYEAKKINEYLFVAEKRKSVVSLNEQLVIKSNKQRSVQLVRA